MNSSLVVAGLVLLVADVAGWVLGAATSSAIGVVLSAAVALGLAGAWLLVAGHGLRLERIPARTRRRHPDG